MTKNKFEPGDRFKSTAGYEYTVVHLLEPFGDHIDLVASYESGYAFWSSKDATKIFPRFEVGKTYSLTTDNDSVYYYEVVGERENKVIGWEMNKSNGHFWSMAREKNNMGNYKEVK